MADKDTQAMKQALMDLFDKDETKVMKALKKVTRDGKARHMSALMDLYVKSADGPVKSEIEKMLQSTKLPGGEDALVELLEEERFAQHHAFILSCIWHSGYQPVEHMDTIVEVAIKGDYMCALEALTVVENLEPPFDTDALAVASLNVDDYVEARHSDAHAPLIEQIKQTLDRMKGAMAPSATAEDQAD